MARANELEGLTDRQRQDVLLGAEVLKAREDFARKSFDQWMVIARGVAPLCELAKGKSRKARQRLLKEQGYGSLNPSTVSRLLLMVAHETAIRIWRDGLTQHQRDTWNSPTSLCNRVPALRKTIAEAKAANPPRTPRKRTDRVLVVERAFDTIADYGHALQDADARAVLAERLRKLADLVVEEALAKPAAKSGKRKIKEGALGLGGDAFNELAAVMNGKHR